jgi:hypothetical protein
VHGLAYAPVVSKHVVTDSWTYTAAGSAIDHGSYSTPLKAGFYYTYPVGFFDLTGAQFPPRTWSAPERQAFRPPGYPLLLALVGGGAGGVSEAAAIVLQALLFGAGAWLLALTVRRWWGARLAVAAALVYALDPYSKHYVPLLLSEVLAGFLALAAAYAFTRAWQESTAAWWAGLGALVAALTLVRAVFVVALPLALLAALLRRGRARHAAAVGLCAAALLVPWLAWTDSVEGKPVLANWGEGYNLLLAANGEGLGHPASEVEGERGFTRELAAARRSAPGSGALRRDPRAHPRYLLRADERLRAAARRLYAHRLEHEPLEVAWEVAYRSYFLWNAHEDWYQPRGLPLLAMRVLDWIVIVLGLAGAAVAVVRGGAPRGVVAFLALYTLVLGAHHVEARFAMPLRGLLLALATYAVATAYGAARARATAPSRNAQSQKMDVAGLPTDVR